VSILVLSGLIPKFFELELYVAPAAGAAPLGIFGTAKKVPRSKKQAFFMVSVRNYYLIPPD
jgi:hypothetical protein